MGRLDSFHQPDTSAAAPAGAAAAAAAAAAEQRQQQQQQLQLAAKCEDVNPLIHTATKVKTTTRPVVH